MIWIEGSDHILKSTVTFLLLSNRSCGIFMLETKRYPTMPEKSDVLQGTLTLMVLKTP